MSVRNRFTNPSNGSFYDWQVNHSEEQEFGKRRSIDHGALTDTVGVVRQQADDSPLILQLKGTIFHKAQFEQFKSWFALSRTQTIYYRDFAGDEYEVIITAFLPVRERTIKNPRDFAHAPYWFWKYDLEMEVITIRAGSWAGVTP